MPFLIITEEKILLFLFYHFLFSSGSSAQATLMMFKTRISNDTPHDANVYESNGKS